MVKSARIQCRRCSIFWHVVETCRSIRREKPADSINCETNQHWPKRRGANSRPEITFRRPLSRSSPPPRRAVKTRDRDRAKGRLVFAAARSRLANKGAPRLSATICSLVGQIGPDYALSGRSNRVRAKPRPIGSGATICVPRRHVAPGRLTWRAWRRRRRPPSERDLHRSDLISCLFASGAINQRLD